MEQATGTELPRSHESALRLCARIDVEDGLPLENEAPLFMATLPFAREQGGPITRRFLVALPDAWGERVIINSHLVWLTPGLAQDVEFGRSGPGPQRGAIPFRHERFPGWKHGVQGRANRDQEARHLSLTLGGEVPLYALGRIELEADEDPEAFWLPDQGLHDRDRRLRAWMDQGRLRPFLPPANTLVEHGWGCFWRPRPATKAGFQLVLRATHRDGCPPVNALRNLSFL